MAGRGDGKLRQIFGLPRKSLAGIKPETAQCPWRLACSLQMFGRHMNAALRAEQDDI